MFTKLTLFQRISVGLVLAIAFLLVLGSNRLNKRHFSTIQNTVNSVYKDRVVVQNLIYELSTTFHKKELRFILENQNIAARKSENEKVQEILTAFRETKLTAKESNLLLELSEGFEALQSIEHTIFKPSITDQEKASVLEAIKTMELKLDGLAKIQLEESKQLTGLSNKSLGINVLMSRMELGFLVVIGIAMMALIFYPAKKTMTAAD